MSGKMALERAEKIAAKVIERLGPHCHRIEVAGSVRRKKPWVNDIDLVLIDRDPWSLYQELKRLGTVKVAGTKIRRVDAGDVQLDIYMATMETWATLLLIRTGSAGNNIRLCSVAKKKGWHLAASGEGLFDENKKKIAGESEWSIYKALGIPWQEPWERD